MQPFDFEPRTRFVFGEGSLDRLGEIANSLRSSDGTSISRVLVVTDPGLVDAGHFGHAMNVLRESGLEAKSFHDFGENPTSTMVDAGVRFAAEVKPDLLVGLGGGGAAWTAARGSTLCTAVAVRSMITMASEKPRPTCCR